MNEATFQTMAVKRVVYSLPDMEKVPVRKDVIFKTIIDEFVQLAIANNVPITFMNHPEGMHAFDMLNDNERSREIIRATLEFIKVHLGDPNKA